MVPKLIVSDSTDGRRPIHFACDEGDDGIETVKWLIEQGADINCADKYGHHPIHLACWNRSLEIVKLLVANGVDVSSLNDSNYNLLSMARCRCHLEMYQFLMDNGAKWENEGAL